MSNLMATASGLLGNLGRIEETLLYEGGYLLTIMPNPLKGVAEATLLLVSLLRRSDVGSYECMRT